ncbi:hypothetical protein K7432_012662 [Basidiobolus ranarum]|uniref:Uncharacterized protein n=1 Tax=Basidiobolus ranarum TaxID=34480 RepID=A0ABR2WKG1_9FUNG
MEGPEHNSRLPEEDSILEFLASMSPSSSEDSFIDPTNPLLDSNHTNSVGTDMELETGIDHGVTTKISEECDLVYKSPQSRMSTDKVDTYRHSIFDLYHYESDDEDEVLEPASTESSAKYEIDDYAAYTTNNSTVTNLIQELDRL